MIRAAAILAPALPPRPCDPPWLSELQADEDRHSRQGPTEVK